MVQAAAQRAVSWYLRRRPRYLPGNEVRLLQGGDELFPALIAAVDQARFEVWLASYIFHTDDAAQAVARSLERAALRGVRVRVVIDGFGSIHSAPQWKTRWQGSGVALAVYRPLDRWWSWLQPEHLRRMHQKLCVVDGETAFVGGINVLDDRLDLHHGRQAEPRLDYAVQVRGPVVEPIEHTVRALWTRATFGADWRDEIAAVVRGPQGLRRARELLRTMRLVRRPPQTSALRQPPGPSEPHDGRARDTEPSEAGVVSAAFLLRDNLRQRHSIMAALLQACGSAQREIDIACPYFYPGRTLRRALVAAARRGVRVRLLLQGRPDYRIAALAASVLYRELLEGGVRIHEYTPAFLHAKVVRVDARWATVGSSNLDPLSLLVNFEANLAVQDGTFVQRLSDSLEQAFARSHEITVDRAMSRWRGRLQRQFVSGLARLYLRLAGVRSNF